MPGIYCDMVQCSFALTHSCLDKCLCTLSWMKKTVFTNMNTSHSLPLSAGVINRIFNYNIVFKLSVSNQKISLWYEKLLNIEIIDATFVMQFLKDISNQCWIKIFILYTTNMSPEWWMLTWQPNSQIQRTFLRLHREQNITPWATRLENHFFQKWKIISSRIKTQPLEFFSINIQQP